MAPQKPPKVTTSDFLVVFGPENTYFARAPSISRSTLNVTSDLFTKLNESKTINFIVSPSIEESEGANSDQEIPDPYVSYSKKGHVGDSKLYVPSGDYLPSLTAWLKKRWGTGGLQVVGNSQGAWWGLSSSGTTEWSTGLPRDVRQLLKPYSPHEAVVHLAFGVSGAYVVVFKDGHIDWDLKGCYNKLDAELEAKNPGDLVYVSLSAYQSGHFFAAFRNATVLYEFPESAVELDEDFLAAEGLRVIVPSDTAKHTAIPVNKRPSAIRDFSTDVLKDVTEKTIESAITG